MKIFLPIQQRSKLLICSIFHRYDNLDETAGEDKEEYDGVTVLVEHPTQMKPPGNKIYYLWHLV